jgi:hypothetical protein
MLLVFLGLGFMLGIPFGVALLAYVSRDKIIAAFACVMFLAFMLPLKFTGYFLVIIELNWPFFDQGLMQLIEMENGQLYAWKARALLWLGELTAIICPTMLMKRMLLRQRAKSNNECLCGYSLADLTTNTCPECGRSITKPCTNSPPSA